VSAVIVHDEVHVEPAGNASVNQIEELAELRGPMPLMELGDHLTGLRVQRGEP
jgi:hypothetical protein